LEGDDFVLNVIPHTQQETIIKNYRVGDTVNLEVDVVARYLERLINKCSDDAESQSESKLSMGFLAEHGFTGKARR
jgi:riboflavin synthase